MKVPLGTVEVDDETMRLLGQRIGSEKATKEQARRFILDNGMFALDDLQRELEVLATLEDE